MRRRYVIEYWILTLLTAPFISEAIQYIWGANPHQVVGLLEVYPITLIFSIVFSIPTLLLSLVSYYILSKCSVKWTISKAILITISVLGAYITLTTIVGMKSPDIAIAYSLTSLIVGLILKLKSTGISPN